MRLSLLDTISRFIVVSIHLCYISACNIQELIQHTLVHDVHFRAWYFNTLSELSSITLPISFSILCKLSNILFLSFCMNGLYNTRWLTSSTALKSHDMQV